MVIPSPTLAGAVHAALALFCIIIGLIQLLRRKGGATHRARGYAFVYAMLVADGTAMLVYQFTGRFNIFHAGAIVNLVCVVLAIVPMLRNPRPPNWKLKHYYFIAWSYVGLISAAATETVVRSGVLATREQIWTATAVTTALVTAVGYVLINRYRPATESPRAAGDIMQHHGAPS
jgi:uncharacterized membrane protein